MMYRHKKRQLLLLLSDMEQSETALKRFCEGKKAEQVWELLPKMQQAAINLGKEIEKTEGKESLIISFLEDYCELVWQCSVTEAVSKQMQISRQISKKRIQIYNHLKWDIGERYQMVFLPYKVSMWDSMESVWLAAKEDERCDAFVVPIPYFEKNTEAVMYYEGKLMPDYVPIVDYKRFLLAEQYPDVIYFHNPFDQYNYVTSVHPDFYSARLKEYCDLLVYIPYFICGGDVPEHLCCTVGVLHADLVIVQSEKMRQTYIKSYLKWQEKKQKKLEKNTEKEKREYWKSLKKSAERKFKSFGSPKFDKSVMDLTEKPVVLKQWKEQIKNKKIIFYNTSLTAMLAGNEKYIDKLKYNLEYLSGREDVIVLWRPHPLSQTTLNTVRPTLAKNYQKICQWYIENKIGIYDDTQDCHTALSIADAYYGDAGSMVHLFGISGKPALIQNRYIQESKSQQEKHSVVIQSAVSDGKFIYFAAGNFNGLYQFDPSTKKMDFLGRFPGEEHNHPMLFRQVILYNQRLYFIPFTADAIAVYHIPDKKFVRIETESSEKLKFVSAAVITDRIYMLPALVDCLTAFNINNQ